jgi:hypothetical protein
MVWGIETSTMAPIENNGKEQMKPRKNECEIECE